ncbi:lasso peptide biosynthesis PqqD family chaperone [Kitasatospora sp. NPDC097605]|uniref:lasso peptide biosynthesis PqqD family chaperone n=1 Tax=Kitasatospora sp. NPDC097605 TaxID=3157226 RepID=UPI003332C2D1
MTFSLAPDVSSTETDDGMVLLQETTGRYWMLNGTGAAIVRLLREGKDMEGVVAELTTCFPQDAARIAADVRALLERLAQARLVMT